MPPLGACPLCLVWKSSSRDLVLQMPQMRWHHLSVHYGPPVGPLGASYREIARSAQLAGGCRADQAARHAREDVPTYVGGTGLPRGGTKAGRELRSKREARSARSPSVATMPKQVCGPWRLATSLIDRPNDRCRMRCGGSALAAAHSGSSIDVRTPRAASAVAPGVAFGGMAGSRRTPPAILRRTGFRAS
jgi:hypothetical protein